MIFPKRKIATDYRKGFMALLILPLFLIFFTKISLCAEENSPLFWPPPPSEMRVTFVKSIYSPQDLGIKPTFFKKLKRFITGEERDILSKPIAIALDRQGTVYVCDPGAAVVHVFNQKEKQYKIISTINKEELVSPVGIAVNPDGLVFIADSKLRKVFCLDKNYRLKYILGGGDTFLRPTGLAADKEKLYVVDTAKHQVFIYNLNGALLGHFGQRGKKDGEFNFPTSIALDKDGNIYVVDTLNFRIQVFDKGNNFLYAIGQIGDSSGSFARPKGVAVDSFGHIYSTDSLSDNVQIFNRNKEFLLSLGQSGHKSGEFWIISGIAIDSENYIYVADSYNQRLQVFRYIGKE